jgi:hypothetical protein
VKFSRGLKWILVILLPLTLAWKLAVHSRHPSDLTEKQVQQRVAEFLIRQHFVVSTAADVSEGHPSLRATAGPCRVLVARSPAVGWDRDLIRRYATDADRVFVVFAGRVYSEQPTWLTVADFLWARFWRDLGFKADPEPVLAVIAEPSCGAERLPWGEVKF